ncbi:hypothetical protein BG000_004151, partial [Podila horticola]
CPEIKMTASSTRPSTGMKKMMYLIKLAILATLFFAVANASCTVSTTHTAKYVKEQTERYGATLQFATSDGFHDELKVQCPKNNRKNITKCQGKVFCITYKCDALSVQIVGANYLGAKIGIGKSPSNSGVEGRFTWDAYYSCY